MGETLKERNEGTYGGVPPVDAAAAAAAGDEDAEREAFRSAMARAAEKQREGQRSRASAARAQRPKVDVGDAQGGIPWATVFPVAVVVLWGVNMFLFRR